MRGARTALVLIVALGVLLTLVPGEAARQIDLARMLEAPSWAAPCGYDDLGRSLAARIAAGARVALFVAATVVAVTAIVGTFLGVVAGWYGGWLDLLIVRVIDIVMAFPGLLLAIALAGVLGPGLDNVIFALSVVGWVGFARLARVQTQALRQRDHVLVSRALGRGTSHILRCHVLPLIAGPLLVEATFAAAGAIVAEAGLSFLGLGLQPPAPSWGNLIRDGMRYVLIAPHAVVMPCLALGSLVLAIHLLGTGLRDRAR